MNALIYPIKYSLFRIFISSFIAQYCNDIVLQECKSAAINCILAIASSGTSRASY